MNDPVPYNQEHSSFNTEPHADTLPHTDSDSDTYSYSHASWALAGAFSLLAFNFVL